MRERVDFLSKLVISIIGISFIAYIFFRHVFIVILPFLLAWALAFFVRVPARYLSCKTRIPERILRLILAVSISVGLVGCVVLLLRKLALEVWKFLGALDENAHLFVIFERVVEPKRALSSLLPSGLVGVVSNTLEGALSSAASAFAAFAARILSGVPSLFLFVLVSFIANVYFALDLEKINALLVKLLPPGVTAFLKRAVLSTVSVGAKYLKAYATLGVISFLIIFIGLLLLGVEYALLISLFISVLDALPVIGIGTALVPWALAEYALGKSALGLGLLVLFLIAATVRQIAEPRIVGKNLGLHPLVSLVLLYGSYSLFGFLGILLIPVFSVAANTVFDKNDPSKID